MGQDYAGIKLVSTKEGCVMRYVTCKNVYKGSAETVESEKSIKLSPMKKPYTQKYAVDDIPQPRESTPWIYVRTKVHSEGIGNSIRAFAQFSYSMDGKKFTDLGTPFEVKEGKWIGAKLGFYCMRPGVKNDAPFFDVDWIHFTK